MQNAVSGSREICDRKGQGDSDGLCKNGKKSKKSVTASFGVCFFSSDEAVVDVKCNVKCQQMSSVDVKCNRLPLDSL